jgi:CBS domain-containing protein
MFDPSLTVRFWGLRWATHASCVVVLAVVVGGVLSRLIRYNDAAALDVRWLMAAGAALAGVVVAVAGHEIVRVWAWRRCGTTIRRVEFNLFGGSVEFTDGTATPRAEALGALIAFLALQAVAVAVAIIAFQTRHSTIWLQAPVKTVAIAVVSLAALQAMPALQLDGGRVLHAWFWYLTDSSLAATRAAAIYAHVIAAALLGSGIVLVARPREWPFWGLGAAVAGLQLEGAARRTMRRAARLAADASVTIRALMPSLPATVPIGTLVDDAVELLLAGSVEGCLLVVDADREPRGVLRMVNLRGTRRSAWDRLTVDEIATPLAKLPRLPIDQPFQEALAALDEPDSVAVVEDGTRVAAIVTRNSVLAAFTEFSRKRVSG